MWRSPVVFCDTKRRCENVAELLAKIIYNRPAACEQILAHRAAERTALAAQLMLESAGFLCPVLAKTLRFGIGYHHRSVIMGQCYITVVLTTSTGS